MEATLIEIGVYPSQCPTIGKLAILLARQPGGLISGNAPRVENC